MTENDIFFKFYEEGERPDPNCFCHYGWEGKGSFAFWKYACAYYDSAEALFQKFLQSKGDLPYFQQFNRAIENVFDTGKSGGLKVCLSIIIGVN